jgi:hypothetical protein
VSGQTARMTTLKYAVIVKMYYFVRLLIYAYLRVANLRYAASGFKSPRVCLYNPNVVFGVHCVLACVTYRPHPHRASTSPTDPEIIQSCEDIISF